MPQGFQVFRPSGALKIDLSDRLLRLVDIIFVPAGVPGSAYRDGLLTGTPVVFATMVGGAGASWPGNNLYPPAISVSGGTVSWGVTNADHRLMLWVY